MKIAMCVSKRRTVEKHATSAAAILALMTDSSVEVSAVIFHYISY